jgi:tRNA(Ile)-lysidine synthase
MVPRGRSVGTDRLASLFACFEGRRGVVLAVSGGSDSLALMWLSARWRDLGRATPLSVATIDHGLRPEAAEECRRVAERGASLGLPCRILAWDGPKPRAGLQEAARAARRSLLADAARAAGADAVALAHTEDDQAETVLMRLAHGSGIDGLGAMRAETAIDDVVLLRPLLGLSREDLRATLAEAGWNWSDDPSNTDDRFERVRARRALAALYPLGLTSSRLARFAERAARAADALDVRTEMALSGLERPAEGAAIALDVPSYAAEPTEIRLRLLAAAVARAAGSPPPRLDRVEALEAALSEAIAEGRELRRSLGGAVVSLDAGQVLVSAEGARRRGRSRGVGQS